MRTTEITPVEECAFEPESTEIRCVECNKPTGKMGTCQEVDFCSSCRDEFIQGSMYDGATRVEAEARFSAMLVSMIEGTPYRAKYARQRVMHISIDNKPACHARGGPHPLTTNPSDSNCKRCLKATQG
jgi:hypothetical protein